MFQEIAFMHTSYQPEQLLHRPINVIPIKTAPLKHNKSDGFMEDKLIRNGIGRQNGSVVGQKLRASKWFTHDEINILCAVVESGFVLQKKDDTAEDQRGIVLWTPGHEKSKDPDHLTIYTVSLQNGVYKLQVCGLLSFWAQGTQLKINNQSDQTNVPNNEEVIRNQILYAQNNKHKWHNSEHFTYWCRYGSPAKGQKTKTTSESLKWGHFGLNAGLFLLRNRKRTNSTSN